MRTSALFLALAAAVGGCATPAEQAAQQQQNAERMMQIYGPACDKLGYMHDTDKWRDCVLQLSAQQEYPARSPAPYYPYYPPFYRYW